MRQYLLPDADVHSPLSTFFRLLAPEAFYLPAVYLTNYKGSYLQLITYVLTRHAALPVEERWKQWTNGGVGHSPLWILYRKISALATGKLLLCLVCCFKDGCKLVYFNISIIVHMLLTNTYFTCQFY